MLVVPQEAPCGAIIHGLDLSRDIDVALCAEVRALWLKHLVPAIGIDGMPDEHITVGERTPR